MHAVYIIHSESLNRFYIGETNDLELRLKQHLSGFFSTAYTRNAAERACPALRVGLSAASPRYAAGFPLLSLTHRYSKISYFYSMLSRLQIICLFFSFLCIPISGQAQEGFRPKDHDLKLLAGHTGLGLGFEYNLARRFYIEGLGTSSFHLHRLAAQAKYALFSGENYTVKAGLEGALILHDQKADMSFLPYDRPWLVMPHITFNYSDIGIELSNVYERNVAGLWGVKGLFPVASLTFNVYKSRKKD